MNSGILSPHAYMFSVSKAFPNYNTNLPKVFSNAP